MFQEFEEHFGSYRSLNNQNQPDKKYFLKRISHDFSSHDALKMILDTPYAPKWLLVKWEND